jgi:hypothetical protein
MLGYIVPQKSELRVREYEIYNAYYCAVCHSIRDRYGQLPRLMLSFDSVFLAMLAASLSDEDDAVTEFRCGTHPWRKRNTLGKQRDGSSASVRKRENRPPASLGEIDYAADMLILLGYYNLLDDKADEKKAIGYLGSTALSGAFKKAKKNHPEKAELIQDGLRRLSTLEGRKEGSIDVVAEPFAKIMEEVFDIGAEDKAVTAGFRKIGYHIGKWIYLIDAADDLEKDRKKHSYNPLRYKAMDRESLLLNLRLYLSAVAETMDLLPIRKNRAILENIAYIGMNKKTDDIAEKFGNEE